MAGCGVGSELEGEAQRRPRGHPVFHLQVLLSGVLHAAAKRFPQHAHLITGDCMSSFRLSVEFNTARGYKLAQLAECGC